MMKDSNGIMTKTSERTMQINIGPQHPSTHGVLRMLVTLSGEQIIKIDPIICYLHRGMEKMAESRTYLQYLPIVDRIDYLSGFFCSYAYISAIENLINTDIPIKAKYIRTLTMEMNRISSHLLWLGCYLLDLGATSPLFYTFIEREKIIDILEDLSKVFNSKCACNEPEACGSITTIYASSLFTLLLNRLINRLKSL